MAMDPQSFGRYRNLRKLAGGGMARVYLGEDLQMSRTVFLKLIDAATDEEGREIIDAERRGAALQDQLAHREPGGRVAKIYEIGDLDGYFFIAMEFVEGEDLSEIIRRGPIAPGRAVTIALNVLAVLGRAHGFQAWVQDREYRGIIHGDIKPQNIRITPNGAVKLLDFGIAKAITATRGKTQNYFASARYCSPQRLESGEVDAPADLWSVATVLFEMLTSRPYFDATDLPKLEAAIRKYDSLKQTVMLVPSDLREILRKALDPDPRKRFHTAAEFQAALETRSVAQAEAADPDATRRTTNPPPPSPMDPDATRRSTQVPPRTQTPPSAKPSTPSPFKFPWKISLTGLDSIRTKAAVALTLCLAVFLWFTYEVRMWRKADALRSTIESGQISFDDAERARLAMEKQAWLPAPIYPARNALRDRYRTDAEHVIDNYRSFSPGAVVTKADWTRARNFLAKAVRLAPDDKVVRADLHVVDGHLKIRAADLKGALSEFEDAKKLQNSSPDPHLGLAAVHLMTGELDRAEDEFQQASKLGFHPGRLQQQSLAYAYKSRADRGIAQAKLLHDIDKMVEAYKRADADLERAQNLYAAISPYGLAQADRIAAQRREIQFKLSEAGLAQPQGGTR